MTRIGGLAAFVILLLSHLAWAAPGTVLFDSDWKFCLGDPAGAADPTFDDSSWRSLDVPHDWSIEGPIDQKNLTGKAGGFFPAGVGWYRKRFDLPADDGNDRVFIDFDGVMANSDVAINGFQLGHRPNGYVSFRYELTGHVFIDRPNVIAVRCDNSLQPASRFYCGAGIYRHVHLVIADPIHLDHWGVYVTTPKVSAEAAAVRVRATVVNQSDSSRAISVKTTLLDPAGNAVATKVSVPQSVAAGQTLDFTQDFSVAQPKLWDLDQPNLYRAVAQIVETSDEQTAVFGIREFHFDAASGFWLNGRNFKLYGCCLHDDAGALGMAVPLSVWQRRLEALKSIGCNAIRTAHNPPAPEFLDLCDRMGFLVMDEMFDVWKVGKSPLLSRAVLNDYHLYFDNWWKADVTDAVRRDRNHPCIVLYSAGNEIHDISAGNTRYAGIFRGLDDLYHQLDPTRPVTLALLRPNQSHVYDNGFAARMDVVGQNYRENELVAAHAAHPDWKIIGTENRLDPQAWLLLRDTPAYAGQFIWTGVDYLGESAAWPMIAHSSGLFDRTIWPAAGAFQAESWWSKKPTVHIVRVLPPLPRATPVPPPQPGMDGGAPPRARYLVDWTSHQTGEAANHIENVEVYTNCEQVDLLLNGRSLGPQHRHADDTPLRWKVPYAPGTLQAIALNAGQQVATDTLHSAGPAAKIVLTADREHLPCDWDDVCFVRAFVTDADGITVPDAANPIHFAISGPGQIDGVDNSDNSDHDSFAASDRHTYRGRCLAIVRAISNDGTITVTATADGVAGGSVSLEAVAATAGDR